MTKTTWPDPDRPGVPLNPEKDGWHWVNLGFSIINPTPCPVLWRPRMGWTSPLQKRGPDDYIYPEAYLGPCLTPEEVAALEARADRNAAGYARVDHKARLAEFLHKQEIAAKDARIAKLERLLGLADSWISAAIECKEWRWDADQHEAATHTRDEICAALGGKDG